MPKPTLLQRLKERKLVQWGLAYLAGAFVVFQLLDALETPLGLSAGVQRSILVAVAIGFFIALVLAWYHADKGRQRVSGPELLMVAALLIVAGVSLTLLRRTSPGGVLGPEVTRDRSGASSGNVRSLAVLPFDVFSGEASDQFLAGGLHDQLITELSRLSWLEKVTSRTSVLRFAEGSVPVPAIADSLSVDGIIEGSVFPNADRVRINVQLIDGVSDRHLWAQDYERPRVDALDLVKAVAQDISEEIHAQLDAQEASHLASRRSVAVGAQEAYFRGRAAWNERTQDGYRRAVEQFERALEIEPEYAPAYAGLASVYLLRSEPGDRLLAQEAARRALDLDPELAEAHTALAYSRMLLHFDWEGAEAGFQTAIALQPGYATAHQWYAEYLVSLWRFDEAVASVKRARELDPFSPIIAWNEVRVLYFSRRFQEALDAEIRRGEQFPDFRRGGYLLKILCQLEDRDGLIETFADFWQIPDSVSQEWLEAGQDGLVEWAIDIPEEDRPPIVQQLLEAGGGEALRSFIQNPVATFGPSRSELTPDQLDWFFAMLEEWMEDPLFPLHLPEVLTSRQYDQYREDPRWETVLLQNVGLSSR